MFWCIFPLLISTQRVTDSSHGETTSLSSTHRVTNNSLHDEFTMPSWAKEAEEAEGAKDHKTTLNDWWEEAMDEDDEPGTEAPQNISVSKAVTDFKIVPDILSVAPENGIQITYGENSTVYYGNFIPEEEVVEQPKKIYWEADSAEYYTLLMSAPDMPSRKYPVQREWLQWMIGNIRGNSYVGGEVIAEYMTPYGGRDSRRFVFLVFKQPDKIDFQKKLHPDRTGAYIQPTVLRPLFSTKDFAKLLKLGEAVAVNFFRIKPKVTD